MTKYFAKWVWSDDGSADVTDKTVPQMLADGPQMRICQIRSLAGPRPEAAVNESRRLRLRAPQASRLRNLRYLRMLCH